MPVRPILLLGTPSLFEPSTPIEPSEAAGVARDLLDTMEDFRSRHGWGRAIAAPQIGVNRRLVAMRVGEVEAVFVNPELVDPSPETVEVWEDCMSLPDLLVRIRNPAEVTIRYTDLQGRRWRARLSEDYAQLLIHEVEHLDGQLITMRPVHAQGIVLRSTQPPKDLSWRGRFTPEPDDQG